MAGLDSGLNRRRETYKALHRHSELGFQEHQTAKLVAEPLESFGYSVQHIGGTAVVGILENGDGPAALSRPDMDALPVTEGTDLPYASEVDGVMHACGHDFHVTALLGAALAYLGGA